MSKVFILHNQKSFINKQFTSFILKVLGWFKSFTIFWFGFFVQWHINLYWLFNAKAIIIVVVVVVFNLMLGNKRILKVNVLARLKFQLTTVSQSSKLDTKLRILHHKKLVTWLLYCSYGYRVGLFKAKYLPVLWSQADTSSISRRTLPPELLPPHDSSSVSRAKSEPLIITSKGARSGLYAGWGFSLILSSPSCLF